MGSTGSGWLHRLLLGSTTEKVVRNATCPVITMKCTIEQVEKLQPIVYVFNPRQEQEPVIHELKKLRLLSKAHLYLLVVVTPSKFSTSRLVSKQLEAFAKMHQLENYSTHIYTDTQQEEGVMHFAEEVNAGLIALGTDMHTNLLQLLTTHVREDIVNHSFRPVWTYNVTLVKPAQLSETDENYSSIH